MCAQQLHSRSVPQDLSLYENFTLPEMPEPNNHIVVIQTPARYYTVDGMDPADEDDDEQITDQPLIAKSTTRACLFCVIPAVSLVCVLLYIFEAVAISKSDNNGFPPGIDEKDAATMTPVDYYAWICNKTKGDGDDGTWLANNKRHIWTWIGASLVISSVLTVLIMKMLLLFAKCGCCCFVTSVPDTKLSSDREDHVIAATKASAAVAASKEKDQKAKMKKRREVTTKPLC